MDLGLLVIPDIPIFSKTKTISSDSSNKKDALEAKIGYWYAISKNKSNKAWVYAQCLIWAAEEGITSENGLKDIISQVKKNTGYYSNDTIYSDIFNPGKTVSCDVDIWEYSGRTKKNQVQRLLQINSTETEYNFYPLKSSDYYRQRITFTEAGRRLVRHCHRLHLDLQQKILKNYILISTMAGEIQLRKM